MTEELLSTNARSKSVSQHSVLLRKYFRQIAETDKLPQGDLRLVILGLFGEVGSVMATAKKHHREKEAYTGFRNAVIEEFGDVLWYFTTLCKRLGYEIDDIFLQAVACEDHEDMIAASDLVDGPLSRISVMNNLPCLDDILPKLGHSVAALLPITGLNAQNQSLLCAFATHYLQAVQAARISFSQIVHMNVDKVCGRFLKPNHDNLPTFDSTFPEQERLPKNFVIKITQHEKGESYLQWNDVYIGDPLTDNNFDQDDYRFHDVFHLAHAAILHWSPTFRALIKHKRKSNPKYDKVEDGGRAIFIEEGLTVWVFSYAKDLNFFEGQQTLSFDLLKTIRKFVRGYEVEKCPLSLWEYAILEGYKVFRLVRKNNGGIIIGDSAARTIEYKEIEKD